MSRLPVFTAALLALLLAGCGTPSRPLPMAIGPADALQIRGWVPEALKAQVGVAPVKGGLPTGRWWGSKVSAVALQQALDCRPAAGGAPRSAPWRCSRRWTSPSRPWA